MMDSVEATRASCLGSRRLDPNALLMISMLKTQLHAARDYREEGHESKGSFPQDWEVIEARRWLVWHSWDHTSETCLCYGIDGPTAREHYNMITAQKKLWNEDVTQARTKKQRAKARRVYQPALWDIDKAVQ